MKKVVLSLALVAVLGLSFTSCRETKEKTEDAVENAADAADEAAENATDAAGEAVDSAVDATGEAVDSAVDAAGEAVDRVLLMLLVKLLMIPQIAQKMLQIKQQII